MSYAIRNTIILLVTLLIFAGAAFAYIKFVQEAEIEKLTTELSSLEQDLTEKTNISNQYPPLLERYNLAKDIILGYDKTMYKANNPDDVYDYLSEINEGNLELFYDFTFEDSVAQDLYGIINSTVKGTSTYSDFITFINKIENSQLLNKIEQVNLNPVPSTSDFDVNEYISFSLELKSYYQKEELATNASESERFRVNPDVSVFNPFKPLILNEVPENIDNLVNVESSRLLGFTSARVFLVDQNGDTKILRPGDKVYLGYLDSIDTNNREVIFDLNKGGIKELFTLKVER